VLQVKVVSLSSIMLFSSLSFTMDEALVRGNGTIVSLSNHPRGRSEPFIFQMSANASPKKQDIVKGYHTSEIDFLNKAAARELSIRRMHARIISNQIDAQYIGTGDQWSFKRQVITFFGLGGAGYVDIKDAIKDLAEICSHVSVQLNRPLIDAVREENYRFDSLMERLIGEKIRRYDSHMSSHCFRPCIVGSNIDDFFNSQHIFPDLPASLQKYIQFKTEQDYRDSFRLKDSVPFVLHVLQKAFLNSRNQEQLQALLMSSTLKKYEDKNVICLFQHAIRGRLAKINEGKPDQIVDVNAIKAGVAAESIIKNACRCADGTVTDYDDCWFDCD